MSGSSSEVPAEGVPSNSDTESSRSGSSSTSSSPTTVVAKKQGPAVPPLRALLRPKAEVRRLPLTRYTVRTHYPYEELQRKVPNSFLLLPGGPPPPVKAPLRSISLHSYLALTPPAKSAKAGVLVKAKGAGKGKGKVKGVAKTPGPIAPPPKRNL